MGLNWSDILYPDNPKRRDEVNKLAQGIRTSVDQIFGNVRTMSKTLNQACNKYQVLDPLDLNITYEANFKKLNAVLDQWKRTTEEIMSDPSIPQQIKDLMSKFDKATSVGQFPDTVKEIMSDPSLADKISEPVVGMIVGSVATYYASKYLLTIISSTLAAVSAAGLLGALVGAAIGLLVGIIIGAIEGAKEREDLEELKRKYKALDDSLRNSLDSLEDEVAAVVVFESATVEPEVQALPDALSFVVAKAKNNTMGLNWSDILYPDNPKRRDEVNKLAQGIRTSVDQIFGNVRTMSKTLNQACNKYQVLDPLDLNITYEANFKKLNAVLDQWKRTTEEIMSDPSIPQQIKDLMSKFDKATSVGQFPDTVKEIMSDPSLADKISEPVVGMIVGSVATYYASKYLLTIISSTLAAVSAAGLLGALVGAAIGLLVGIIIGAIEGAKEREDLEELKRKYKALDDSLRNSLDSLEDEVAAVVRAIIKAS
ncbi:hypothetical protein L7F22_047222 [Adiantum nelumboides]|nr:hypothetical protein [Adiantum nelumboides]